MNEPKLLPDAERDLDEILEYLAGLPAKPAQRITEQILACLRESGTHPLMGAAHSELTLLLEEEVRTRLVKPYRIFYKSGRDPVEIIAILHMARDVQSILRARFS